MARKSSAEKLPKELRQRLLELLQDPKVTQAQIAEIINSEAGFKVVSKSGVNRYSQKMHRFAEKNRQARAVAEAYLDKIGTDTRNRLGKVVNEQIRLMVFDLIGELEESKDSGKGLDPSKLTDIIYKISRGLRELEQAEKINVEQGKLVRTEALNDAALTAENEGRKSGLSEKAIIEIKNKILGLA